MKAIRIIVSLLVVCAGGAAAFEYQDIDAIGITLDGRFGGYPGIYEGMFDLGDLENDIIDLSAYGEGTLSDKKGYDGAPPDVLTAQIAFYVQDDYMPWDRAREMALVNIPYQWIHTGWYHDFQAEVFGGSVGIYGRAQIEIDGTLSYDVYAGPGSSDFIIDYARLTITTENGPVGVADSGLTLSLLGMALLSLSVMSRSTFFRQT